MLLNNGQQYKVVLGDSIPGMAEMPPESIDHAVFSPPFPSVYAFTSFESDLGNSEDKAEMRLHFSFFMRQLLRVMKPGRVVMLHCMDIVRMKRSGGDGLFDFSGFLARLGERAGFVYDYKWAIRCNQQAQAIKTRSRQLQFAGLENDRAQSRGALPEYMIKFRKPGDNKVPIRDDNCDVQVTRNEWIDWAEYCWTDIRETHTLNVKEAKGENDTKHLCPLRLDAAERSIRLFSNPGEIILSPFAGVGTEISTALRLGRHAFGLEIKDEYYQTAILNCERVLESQRNVQPTLFDLEEASTLEELS